MAGHLVGRIKQAHPTAETVYISLHNRSQPTEGILDDGIYVVYDTDDKIAAVSNAGPAAGLLAAYHLDRTAHWLVVACDYPLLSAADLRQLVDNYQSPLTCFENAEGWPEPLLAIWSPSALDTLEHNVRRGVTGPIKTLRGLLSKKLRPLDERSLMNINTPMEWEAALRAAAQL